MACNSIGHSFINIPKEDIAQEQEDNEVNLPPSCQDEDNKSESNDNSRSETKNERQRRWIMLTMLLLILSMMICNLNLNTALLSVFWDLWDLSIKGTVAGSGPLV